MNIRHILSTAVVATALFAAQGASAQGVQFFKKHSEVTAAQAKVDGKLAVRMTIRQDGSVGDVRVVRSCGHADVDAQAVAWMSQQIVRPMTMNGQAQEFSVVKEIQFSRNS